MKNKKYSILVPIAIAVLVIFFFAQTPSSQSMTLITIDTCALPVYSSPISNIDYNISCYAHASSEIALSDTRENNESQTMLQRLNPNFEYQSLYGFFKMIEITQSLSNTTFSYTVSRNITIYNEDNQIIYQKTLIRTDGNDTQIQILVPLSDAPVNSTLTIYFQFSVVISYSWNSESISYSKVINKAVGIIVGEEPVPYRSIDDNNEDGNLADSGVIYYNSKPVPQIWNATNLDQYKDSWYHDNDYIYEYPDGVWVGEPRTTYAAPIGEGI